MVNMREGGSPLGVIKDIFRNQQSAVTDQRYLLGFRGVLIIEGFLWMFLQVFAPATVRSDRQQQGPLYQNILRKTLSVILWNETFIASAFIFLSARTICLPFLKNTSRSVVASACFRRGLRLCIPVLFGSAVVKIAFSALGVGYIEEFKRASNNTTMDAPYQLKGAVAFFNSVWNLFWITHNFGGQAGSTAFPSGTLWMINVIYSQSFTVYMTMVVIPYTRSRWQVQAFALFIISAWWVQSWAWFSVTGLLFADAVVNMDFKAAARRGIPVWRTSIRIPTWIASTCLFAAGIIMKYLWVAWRPQAHNVELHGHSGLYYSGGYNTEIDLIQPQARDDDYVLLFGLFLFIESSDIFQNILSNPFFVYLGSRSLSYFLVSSTIVYTAGIKTWLALQNQASGPLLSVICLLVSLLIIAPSAEVFHRLIDHPSRLFAYKAWDWLRE